MVDIKKLKSIMETRAVTQKELAEVLNITEKTVGTRFRTGIFTMKEIEKTVDFLKIENPFEVFFPSLYEKCKRRQFATHRVGRSKHMNEIETVPEGTLFSVVLPKEAIMYHIQKLLDDADIMPHHKGYIKAIADKIDECESVDISNYALPSFETICEFSRHP